MPQALLARLFCTATLTRRAPADRTKIRRTAQVAENPREFQIAAIDLHGIFK
jgi:hypothetical protein